ncbi:Rpn family recombination-promoting nuclease/putative transposase [Pseudomonas sp. ABC1]|uniref:Rpn family recombination-promoting nuclease/putative transposase n=1 Tax=Pseudomonas sp. ABC1 TaxID=2748080 RepID=UPI0015C2E730|nr:Rpn family recombination-promoting nuclease/putative transposase [Pseudomonas sp. ABC1]QLF93352.1 Rpn family recombination-promoting nuclease/putative transposase [Pseudomonas sp. ABC1]
MPGTSLLDPKNDFVFKRLFASAPDLLTDLINCIRSDSDEAPIAVVEILNPHIAPEDLHGKFIVLDLLARDSQGQLYDVEMQVRRHAGYGLRSLYYLARTLGQQLSRGEHYSSLKPVIGIHRRTCSRSRELESCKAKTGEKAQFTNGK